MYWYRTVDQLSVLTKNMFEAFYAGQRTRGDRVRGFITPLVIGVLIALPRFAYYFAPPFEKWGAVMDFVFEWVRWVYFPDVVLLVFDADFLGTAANAAIASALTISFYAGLVCWCRYWIEEGYIEGLGALPLWKHWPFRIGMSVFVPFFVLRIYNFVYNWRRYHVIQHDEEAFLLGFFMYLGGMTALLSAIIVIGRRIRAKREARESEESTG